MEDKNDKKGYEFNQLDFPKITVHLLIEVIAFQQAILEVLIDKIAVDDTEADKIYEELNSVLPGKKEIIIESLYTAFGKTPKVS